MPNPPLALSIALGALSASIMGLAPGMRATAQTASSSQATASAAISKPQMSRHPVMSWCVERDSELGIYASRAACHYLDAAKKETTCRVGAPRPYRLQRSSETQAGSGNSAV